jgi:hypothetical protein
MRETLLFELPSEPQHVAEIVDTVPSNWNWFDGYLTAPRILYEKDQIARDTVLALSRFYCIKPTIQGQEAYPFENEKSLEGRRAEYRLPGILDIVKGKQFAIVNFDEAGFETSSYIPFESVREIASHFIRLGYKGWLSVYSGYRENSKTAIPEKLDLSHRQEKIKLSWDEEYDGKKENLESLLAKLKQLGVKEIIPSPVKQ